MFTATVARFFVEFTQRIPNADGEPFSDFNTRTIDDLHEAVDRSKAAWGNLTPSGVLPTASGCPKW